MSLISVKGNTKSTKEIKKEYMEIIKYHKSIQYNIIYDELALNEINLEKN